ncbi:phosphoribosylformylglycinamidine synthase subunit PurL [Candidatus Micrarchaeota archaeon CG10_big_fil_rev_8_21_14_0_10_45_29]|nr:MAG: phosphoribosylformylglycinamidine synthase subunit PurL [Candidatus Micrarchaeota archaeon CG10_big_fil_rev_8_21_14_0_10_45_29]
MVRRIEAALKPDFADPKADAILQRIRDDFGATSLHLIRRANVCSFEKELSEADATVVAGQILCDPVNQQYCLDRPIDTFFNYAIEIGFRPGVKDNVADTIRIACEDALNKKIEGGIYTSTLYLFYGEFPKRRAKEICEKLLCNPLIERYSEFTPLNARKYYLKASLPKAGEQAMGKTLAIKLPAGKKALERLSKKRLLALTAEEMLEIKKHYAKPSTKKTRKKLGLPPAPTDVEIECIAQTWSEHCKHKIFNAQIDYIDKTQKPHKRQRINSLFKTYIAGTTQRIEVAQPYLLSVFEDNAGIIAIDDEWALALKAETHNTPSALDPYGGALTGILGVNRDVLGSGLGAKPIFNTDVFCFAHPNYDKKLPPRILHPKRVFEGVRAGVERGGNASGIPTVNGSIVFHDSYLGKPLVYCGTGGIMPRRLADGRETHIKRVQAGARIFMVGGKIGKDGIHGATFSSIELNEASPTSAVQLGDPFTQKIMLDFLLESRDKGLHSALTDNGAGGLSSSVGEMSQMSGGAQIHLEKCPLKYPGLNPWEIFVSESQERMTVAVPPQNCEEFISLAKKFGAEATDIGEFTSTGNLVANYHGKTVLCLPLEFLHGGLPKMKLTAILQNKKIHSETFPIPNNLTSQLLSLLQMPDICSKESIVRQYDHEVQGMGVIKPLCGVNGAGPSDAAVLQPFYGRRTGIVISHGICPRFSQYDAYDMAQLAVDEAVRNYIATGGDPRHWAALDNFCWPDPVQSKKNKDGAHKLAQLVRANQGMADACLHYNLPLVSGKDSMKNDYSFGKIKISVLPTLLISMCGVMLDARRAVSTDFKKSGDIIYALGKTRNEMRGSQYCQMHEKEGKEHPKVNLHENYILYKNLHHAMQKGLISAAHDVSDGGIAVTLAEMAIGGQLGMHVKCASIPHEGGMRDDEILFSETAGRFIVTIKAQDAGEFEKIMQDCEFAKIGNVISGTQFVVGGANPSSHITTSVKELESAFKKTITW